MSHGRPGSRTSPLLCLILFAALIAGSGLAATVPPSPSGLTVTSQSWNSFDFSWRDNASNESGQRLYISEGGAPFYLLTEYGPDRSSGRLLHLNTDRTYKLYLTAFNSAGESARSNTLSVFIPPPDLQAVITWSPASPTTADTIGFRDGSRGQPSSWSWDFGDGTTAAGPNPDKRYAQAGSYVVTLTVGKSGKSSQEQRTITVTGGLPALPPLSASIDCGSCSSREGLALQLSDRSSGAPERRLWNFGDGQVESSEKPLHLFTTAGDYVVTLTVYRGAQSSIATRVVTITRAPRVVVPAAARTGGADGSNWRTELSIANEGTSIAEIEAELFGTTKPVTKQTLRILPKTIRDFSDVIHDLFVSDESSGAISLRFMDGAGAGLKVSSRTFSSDSTGGTFGQSIAAVPSSDESAPLLLTGLQLSERYRTNVGLVNSGTTEAALNLTLRKSDGSQLQKVDLYLPPNSFRQNTLQSLFALSPDSLADASITVASSSSNVLAYASIVDNLTADPTYVGASRVSETRELVIPLVARVAGARGTLWRSDLSLYNAADSPATLILELPGIAGSSRELTLTAGQSKTLPDVLSWLGADQLVAPLLLRSSIPVKILATTRSYTTREDGGTYGQTIPAVRPEQFHSRSSLSPLHQDNGYRTNLGFLNRSGNPAIVTIALRSADGSSAGTARLSVPPNSSLQHSLSDLFSELKVIEGEGYSATATSDAPLLFFASVIDNISGDPSFLIAE